MAFSVNPLQFQSLPIATIAQQQVFLQRLASYLSQLQTSLQSPAYLASILNNNALLTGNALVAGTLLGSNLGKSIQDLGTITTDQTIAVAGANFVFVRFASASAQTRTLTFSNLPQGAVVMIELSTTVGTLVLKLAATDTSGNTYSATDWNTTSAATTNLVATGQSIGVGVSSLLFGMSGFVGTAAAPVLYMLYV
jgi:hypothetical protein